MNIFKDEINKNYNLKVVDIEKNIDSTDGNVYNIKTIDCEYILKIYKSEEHTKTMSKLYEELLKNNFYVPKIIKTNKNEKYIKINDLYLILYSFLKGKNLYNKNKGISKEISVMLGRKLKIFHKVNCKNTGGLKTVEFINDNTLRKSVLHFDLTSRNIFYNKEKNEIGFIDFDDAKYGPAIIDISILIANCYFSKSRGIDKEGIKEFLNAYYDKDIELKRKEVILIKDISKKWIEYVMTNHEFDSSIKQGFETKKKLIENFNFDKI